MAINCATPKQLSTRIHSLIWKRKQPTGMKSFPTVYELATATEDEVNAHWAGLGFYRRARYLHQGAKYVVEELDGKLPTTPRELLKITGIGPYTVRSVSHYLCVHKPDVCKSAVFDEDCSFSPRIVFLLPHSYRHQPFRPSRLASVSPSLMVTFAGSCRD
jgi:hypothetical protein